MPDYTKHYNLIELSSGESLSTDGYKFTKADRVLMDRLLYQGAEGHKHTGEASSDQAPVEAPTLTIDSTQGTLSSGSRAHYKFTFISPEGIETTASPETFIDTPPSVVAPAAPTGVVSTVGGTLTPGGYYYVLTAYTDASNYETAATSAVYVTIPAGTSTNKITLTLPTLPGGADGFNLYRRTPSGQAYLHVATQAITGGTPTTIVDNGSLVEDCDRFAPTTNTTVSTNSVLIAIPGVTPALPAAGWAWRIYRTFNSADWSASMLMTISDGSLDYLDLGGATAVGAPPSTGVAIGTPSRIQLTNAAEVQGHLPLSRMSAFPMSHTFSLPGPTTLMVGNPTWVCPYPQATVVGVQVALGRGASADAQSVIVDVNRYRPTDVSPAYTSLFSAIIAQPKVAAGNQVGAMTVPDAITELEEGDRITVDIDQTGGGAHTDRDLTVTIYMHAYGWTANTSHTWVAP